MAHAATRGKREDRQTAAISSLRSARGGEEVQGRVAGELADRARRHDGAALRIGLVVVLDLFEIVEVIDHQAVRLPQALGRAAGEPIDLLKARAVAEVEPGDRIEWHAARRARAEEIRGRR